MRLGYVNSWLGALGKSRSYKSPIMKLVNRLPMCWKLTVAMLSILPSNYMFVFVLFVSDIQYSISPFDPGKHHLCLPPDNMTRVQYN